MRPGPEEGIRSQSPSPPQDNLPSKPRALDLGCPSGACCVEEVRSNTVGRLGPQPPPQRQTVWAAMAAGLPGCSGEEGGLTAWLHSPQRTFQKPYSSAQSQFSLRLERTALRVCWGGEGRGEGSAHQSIRCLSMCTLEIFFLHRCIYALRKSISAGPLQASLSSFVK